MDVTSRPASRHSSRAVRASITARERSRLDSHSARQGRPSIAIVATREGTSAETAALGEQINSVYADAKAVGSLVTEPDRGRSTEWDDEGRGKTEPKDWWANFWATQEGATRKE
jgi:hypothetical protein